MSSDTKTRGRAGLLRGRPEWPHRRSRGHATVTPRVPAVAASDRGIEPATPAAVDPTPNTSAATDAPYWTPSRMAGVLCMLTFVAQDTQGQVLNEFQAIQDVLGAGLMENPPGGRWHLTTRGTEVLEEWGLDCPLDVVPE
jgi:hypothetical protein